MTTSTALPAWQSVLAIVAHPDDESFGLGAVVSAFVATGTQVNVLCFTRGEASTLHGVDGDLAAIRAAELHAAAGALGIATVRLLDLPDGGLHNVDRQMLVDHIWSAASAVEADGFLVFDSTGITGHPDHVAATAAAVEAAVGLGLGVLAWTLPESVARSLNGDFGAGFIGRESSDVDLLVVVDRTRQLAAVDMHPSQAIPTSVLWARLELMGSHEHLRWLNASSPAAEAVGTYPLG